MMEKPRVLITGANGLLGQKLVLLFQLHQYPFIATGRGPLRWFEHGIHFNYEPMDISDSNDIHRVFSQFKPQFIIHAAAMTHVDQCELDPQACFLNNVTAVENLLFAAEEYKAHFIHISTDFIFDGTSGPYSEEDIPNPLSVYGHSKWEAEKRVQAYAHAHTILRTVLVYGVSSGLSRSNIVLWARDCFKNKKPMKVVMDQFRTPTFDEDLAQSCLLVVEKKAKGVFHISGDEHYSILDLVKEIGRFYNADFSLISAVSSEELNQPAKRPPITGFIIEKAIRDLGYCPTPLKEGLKKVEKAIALIES
jgi:dTDP-4-dehydrorhamnose reductase